MRKIIFSTLFICGITTLFSQKVNSPNGNIVLHFELQKDGTPTYRVDYKGNPIVKTSKLGFEVFNTIPYIPLESWRKGFSVENIKEDFFDETWQPVWGEQRNIRNHYNQLVVTLMQKEFNKKIVLRFRVFDDGVGFRYEFPQQSNLSYFIIKNEYTEFALASDCKAWWIPGDYDTEEYDYMISDLSQVSSLFEKSYGGNVSQMIIKNAVQSPLMLKTKDKGIYLNIHEAALIDYPGMNLDLDSKNVVLKTHLTPDALGNKAYMQTPMTTPWRTIVISDKAEDILASKMILNLNEPCKLPNTDFIKPMKFIGVWWTMIIGQSTWAYSDTNNIHIGQTDYLKLKPNGKHGATTERTKQYIDFAAKNAIDAVLIEGWNTGWEDWFGKFKENVFDFVTPYPDFNLPEIVQYAKSKNVKLIMHHETSSSVMNYERRMDTAYKFMVDNGYHAVKSGYVGDIIPRGEHHYGQWMVQHFMRAITKGADHLICIDAHESVHPTGLSRTYPNFMTAEAARGGEYESFGGNKPAHTTILPFTRLMGGPMDYTPGIFQTKLDYYKVGNNSFVHTTLAKQLALYVTMYSPLQMAADIIDNYERFYDAFQFIKDVAVDWDTTVVAKAEPGEYVCIARKAKDKNDWYVGAITNEDARNMTLNFDFLDPNSVYEAIVYADGQTADYETNPQSYVITKYIATNKSKLTQKLARSGGFAISLKKMDTKDTRLKGLKKL